MTVPKPGPANSTHIASADGQTLVESGAFAATLPPRSTPPDAMAPAEAATTESAVSQQFGKYELLEEVGRGGMGVVFRARQTDLDRTVALKMILSNRLASTDDVRRFYAEARAAGSLRHPNIVAIHEVGQAHGQHFFAMDFVEGRSLAQALREGPFDARRAAQCLAVIGRAVEYLHEHKIIHRDLKPSNILVAADGTLFVTDFGVAKALGVARPQTETGAIVGTLGYMAPEQAGGPSSEISFQSDIYSLGAILFELLTGRPPFRNPNPLDTLMQVIQGEPPRPRQLNPTVPPALERICLKCLEKEPHNRYESAAALVDDLERYLRDEPPKIGPPGISQSLWRWARREPTLAAHLAAVASSALIVQIWYMISGHGLRYHLTVMGIFAVWGAVVVFWHWLLRRTSGANAVRFAWAASDVFSLTLMLYIAADPPEPLGPLLIGYPLLIVAAGLFFRVRLVTFMTVACLLSYGALVALNREPIIRPQYNLIYAAALAVIGFVVGFQAYRVRVLTRYFEEWKTETSEPRS
jgi:tRNA A-37 threonylcarbamoyl transferase component Bud32